jgi:glycosyltransferase involved in cell wall biosynthesis
MSDRSMRRVLVLNQFAATRGHPGGTRHSELFPKLSGWQHVIVAAGTNQLTGHRQRDQTGFKTVPVTPYRSNGRARILNWISYSFGALSWSLRQPRVDVVYASSPHLLTGFVGWLIATLRRVPLVFEVRDLWPRVLVDMGQMTERSLTYRILSSLEKFLYREAERLVIMAEGSRDAITRCGIDDQKIVYIPNGADPSDFLPSANRETLRARYGFTGFTAVYAGAHGPANGLELLLDAAAAIQEEEVEIVLVGDGVAKPGLVARAHESGLRNVRFMDPVPKAHIPDLLFAADVGLHVLADVELFRYGVSPNKVFDYMAAGLPVLTNCPGLISDLVEAAECGIAVSPRDLRDGIEEMHQMYREGILLELGQAGRAWIETNQSRTAMSQRLQRLMDELCNA